MIKLNIGHKKLSAKELENYALKQKNFPLKRLYANPDFSNPLTYGQVNRPGLTLCGFFEYFVSDRIQLFGRGEYSYLKDLCQKNQAHKMEKFLSYPLPCIVFSYGKIPPKEFIQLCQIKKLPLFSCMLSTGDLIEKIHNFFEESYTIKEILNGVMLEVFGTGVLLQGEKGLGKSESALSLIEKGHRLIADDVVPIYLTENKGLIAKSTSIVEHYMEISGIGVINVPYLFGVRSVLKEKNVELVIQLSYNKNSNQNADNIAFFKEILGIKVPLVKIPIERGSNIPLLVETATMNQRLKTNGYNAAEQFNNRVMQQINHQLYQQKD